MRVGIVVALLLTGIALAGCSGGKEKGDTDDTPSDFPLTVGPTTAAVNLPPMATLTASHLNGTAPLNVTFNMTGSDPDADNLTWTLDADGDNVTEAEGTTLPANFTYTYTTNGTFNATFAVSDGANTTVTTVSIEALVGNVTALGPVDHRECSGSFGTGEVGLSYNGPGGPFGGCSLGTAETAVMVVAMEATDGCVHDVSPTGDSTSYGTPNEVGKEWPEGAAFRIICDLGVIEFTGTLDLVVADGE